MTQTRGNLRFDAPTRVRICIPPCLGVLVVHSTNPDARASPNSPRYEAGERMSKMKVYPGMFFIINKSSTHVYAERHRRAVAVLACSTRRLVLPDSSLYSFPPGDNI
jgi:hypothetical protein